MNRQKGFIKMLLVIVAIIAIAVFIYIRMSYRTETIPSDITGNTTSSSSQNLQSSISGELDITSSQSREKDATADWNIYRNDKYGFEFKYPVNFIVSRQTNDSLYLASNKLCVEKLKLSSPGYVESGCLHLSLIIQDNKIIHEGLGVTREAIKIRGLDGEKIIDQSNKVGDEYSNITVQFKKENKWYIFDIINNKNDNKTADDLSNKLLATLRFTK